jgi:hypothetical protein
MNAFNGIPTMYRPAAERLQGEIAKLRADTPMSWARAWNTLRQSKPELFDDLEPDDDSATATAQSSNDSQAAARLVQTKQREAVKELVRDYGFSHRQAFTEAAKANPKLFSVDAVPTSEGDSYPPLAATTAQKRPAVVHAEGDCVVQGGFFTDLREGLIQCEDGSVRKR